MINNAKTSPSTCPQIISIGHFTHDITENGLILGGAAAYSSLSARKLGLRAGVVSAVGKNFLHYDKLGNISLAITKPQEETQTTTFQNLYKDGIRNQFIRGVSPKILPKHIPREWLNADIVYLCPVADEVDPSIAQMFPSSIVGASPQGWMRRWDEKGQVSARKWQEASEALPHINVLVMSEEDISPFPEVVDEYAKLAEIMVLTRGEKGSTLFYQGNIIDFPAFPTHAFDPTGAGDVFTVAFLMEYQKTHDPHKASIFANCTASFVVEKKGTEGIPNLENVYSRLNSRL